MKLLPDWIKNGYLRLVDPVANWMVRKGVHPNTITVVGTLCTVTGGIIYATGHIRTGGWFLGLTALFDVMDGTVARRSNRSSTFGAFLDSTLDRLADGFVPSPARASPIEAHGAGLTPKPHHAQQPRVALRGSFRLRLASTSRSRRNGAAQPQTRTRPCASIGGG